MTQDQGAIRVSDPVHGYIPMTSLERVLLDTRLAQRMRWIAQSGLAHYVFPDLRTSRFIHSLGAMHLASRFLAASVRHAPDDARQAVLEGIEQKVEETIGDIATVGVAADQLDAHSLLADGVVSEHFAPYVQIAEQSLRLAALFHDLGHLPFSHDFEYAIGQLAGEQSTEAERARPLTAMRLGQEALHERIGHDLTYLLLRDVFAHDASEAARVTFSFARLILEASEDQPGQGPMERTPADGVLAWLHTLIDGELDVDRCDYVLRDARSYGFEFAQFDLDRLIDNLVVVKDPEVENALVAAIRPQGHAGVESFLVARARMYQWGPRHHKVAQVGAALQYVIAELLRPALATAKHSPQHPLAPFLHDVETILDIGPGTSTDPAALLERFAHYDDQWWMSYMRAQTLEDNQPWLDLVCWRTEGPISVWKRALDFPVKDLAAWNARLPDRMNPDGKRHWEDAVRSLRQDGVLVIRHTFEPWKPAVVTGDTPIESALSFFDMDHGLTPVSRMSPHVDALREAWLHDVQVHALARSKDGISKEEVLDRLTPDASGA